MRVREAQSSSGERRDGKVGDPPLRAATRNIFNTTLKTYGLEPFCFHHMDSDIPPASGNENCYISVAIAATSAVPPVSHISYLCYASSSLLFCLGIFGSINCLPPSAPPPGGSATIFLCKVAYGGTCLYYFGISWGSLWDHFELTCR